MDNKTDLDDGQHSHSVPLLVNEDGYLQAPTQSQPHAHWPRFGAILVHLAIIVIYTIIFIISARQFHGQNCHESKIYGLSDAIVGLPR